MTREFVVDVLDGETVIGSALLTAVDPSMGVAGGLFTPNANYKSSRHARTETAEGAPDLTVQDSTRTTLKCVGVNLADFSAIMGKEGRELHVLGLEDFPDRFGR